MRGYLMATLACLLMTVLAFNVQAQSSPELIALNPYPDAGSWSSRDDSRTGFFMEVQNGIMAGAYFGFDGDGDNVWFIFSGALQPRLQGGGMTAQNGWELQTALKAFRNGGCISDCADLDDDPLQSFDSAVITLSFVGRSEGTFSIDGGPTQTIYLNAWANPAFAFDPQQPDQLLPSLTGTWLVAIDAAADGFSGVAGSGDDDDSAIIEIGERSVLETPSAQSGEVFVEVSYPVLEADFLPANSSIVCRYFRDNADNPFCQLGIPVGPMLSFNINPDDISDTRFTILVSSDVVGDFSRWEWFRLNYD